MNSMDLLEKMMWIIFVATACINLLIFRRTARSALARQPELKEGYQKLLLGRLMVHYSPLVMMGLGFSLGYVPSLFSYFRPQHGNTYVLAWYLLLFALIAAGFRWIFVGDGARFLLRHRELYGPWKRRIPTTPRGIKRRFVLTVAGALAGLLVMAFAFLPWTNHPVNFMDQAMLARLSFSSAPDQVRSGDSVRYEIGIWKGDHMVRLRAPVSWSVRPDGEGVVIDQESGLLTVAAAVPAGRAYEVTADVEEGRRVLTARFETVDKKVVSGK